MMQFSSLELGAIGVGFLIVLAAVFVYARKHGVASWAANEYKTIVDRAETDLKKYKWAPPKAPPPPPAAPAAPDAAAPPPAQAVATQASAEPKSPSAGSGGTVLVSDAAATAKHSELDKLIADAEAKIADARARKKAIDDALAALKAAVAG